MTAPDGIPGRVLEVLSSALDLPLDRQLQFVLEACGDDVAFRDAVLALLATHGKEEATQILAQPAPGPAPAFATLDFVPALSPDVKQVPPAGVDSPTVDLRDPRQDTSKLAKRRTLDDYELYEPPLGRGGMGIVYKARQISLNRTVALKMILDGEFADPDDVERFQAEAEAAGRLEHPGIVRVLQVGEAEGRHFFSMAFVDGQSLAQALRGGPLPPDRAAQLVLKVAEAVDFAHRQGIIHRDLKPGNILLDQNGDPKVTDFGLAKRLDAGRELTSTGQILGTPSYMSPEQACGRPVRTGADVYSLGAVLYCALTGRPPFQADNPYDTIQQVLSDNPALPRLLNPKVPRDLEQICLKCLAKDPLDRYRSAQALADDLGSFLRGEPVQARPISWLGRGWRWAKRNRQVAAWATTATVVGLAALLVGVVAWHFAQTAQTTGREAATSKAIVTLRARLEERLDASDWSAETLQSLDALVNELHTLNAEEGDKAKQQVEDALAESVRQSLRASSLADPDLRQRIEQRLQLLGVRDPPAAATLDQEYRERLGRQQNVLHVTPTRGDPKRAFADGQARVEDDAIVRSVATNGPPVAVVSTTEPTRGDVTLEVEFGEGWDAGAEVGLTFGEKGYRFLLQTAQLETPALRNAREGKRPARLVIARGTQTLRQTEVSTDLLRQDRLRLVASRRGQLLKFAMNDATSIEIYDFFAIAAAEQGNFGIVWPPAARLRLLLASRQIEPPAASPMEQGDALYAATAYSEALVYYQEQANVLGDALEASEARYKQGLCLAALGRSAEAAAALRPVADQHSGLFSVAAACQLVRLLLQEKQVDEADRHVERLLIDGIGSSSRQTAETMSLASLMPLDVRNSILGHYGGQGGTSYWRHDPQRVAKQERALALSEQLEDIYRGWTQLRLIRAYRFAGNDNAGIAAAKRFLADYWADGVLVADEIGYAQIMTSELSWMLRLKGKADSALVELNRALLDDAGHPRQEMSALLLERVRVYAQLERWDDAQRDLDDFLAMAERDNRHPLHLTEARLMLGFVRQQLGHADAEEIWKQAAQRPEHDPTQENMEFAGGFDIVNLLVAGTLGGEFSDSQVDQFAATTIASQFGVDALRFRLASTAAAFAGIRVAFLRDMWRSERGRDCAFRWTFHQLPFEEHFRMPAQLLAYHLVRETAFGGAPSPAQDTLAWETSGRGTAAITRGEIPVTMPLLTDATKIWAGTSDWSAFSRYLDFDPALRGRAAYILGERFRRLGNADAATALLKAAQNDAPQEDAFQKLVTEALGNRNASE